MIRLEQEAGIQINYYESITPESDVFWQNLAINQWGFSDEKRLGQAGCFFSHVAVWHEIVARGLEFSIVLEDDVDLESMFKYRMEEVYSLEKNTWPDLLLLGHCLTRGDSWSRIAEVSNFYCTHAYGLTLKAATILIRHLDHSSFAPVDIAMRYVVGRKEFVTKGIFPPLVRQLPRGFLGDKSVSGTDELPEQLLEDPILMNNTLYKWFLSRKTNMDIYL